MSRFDTNWTLTDMLGIPRGSMEESKIIEEALPVFPCCVRACFISKFLFLSFVLICARNKCQHCQHQFVMKDRINGITMYHMLPHTL